MSLENPFTFLLSKEKTQKCIFGTNSELLQNRAEKQIMPFKSTENWLFNMWYYLVMALFDWKFQQTVVWVYCVLKLDEGQGIVSINQDDYVNLPCKIFINSTKFKKLKDPTFVR